MVSKIKEKSIANNAITPAKLSTEAGAVTGVKVSSIAYLNDDTAANTIGGDVITVTGAGFTPNTVVYVDRTQASVVTYVSNTQITFSSPAKTAGSYILYLYNADGGSAAYIPGINYSGVPAWSTASGSIGTTYEFTSFTGNVTTLSATSDSTVYYLLNSGTLPTGASLNANTGVITGNTGVVSSQTTYNFVIEAKDQENQGTLRNFSVTINPDTVTWASPADSTLYNITVGGAVNQALSATSAATRGITYTANTLPAGLSISGSNITGTPSAVANTTSLITATSATTNRSATRTLLWYAKSVPGQPTIGTATATTATAATVSFTAPASNGNSPITSYTAVSSPGGITGTLSQAGSGTITVNGLTQGTAYTFTVYATNAAGNSTSSTASNQVSSPFPNATGGTITTSGNFRIHTFSEGQNNFSISAGGNIEIYVWGAAGGATTTGVVNPAPNGGAGGAAYGIYNAGSGTTLIVVVGSGGTSHGAGGGTGSTGYGGKGLAPTSGYAGQGGGYSGVFTSSVSQGNALIMAGGGGGGGCDSSSYSGGAGGGSSGANGVGPNFGSGASQSTGGAGGNGFGTGSALQGGTAGSTGDGGGGGGGGGGYWGGGAGYNGDPNGNSGGGGGSGYLSGSISSATLYAGSGTTPGNSGSTYRGSAGSPVYNSTGNAGAVVFRYQFQ